MTTTVNLSNAGRIILALNVSTGYIALGLLLSLQPPFYPSEAEAKGATPAQYGFVFGIANLSLFIFSPVFGAYGVKIGARICFILGSILQSVSGFAFAFLPYLDQVEWFVGLSYLLRFTEGVGTAMAWSSALGILMKIFPDKVASVMSWTQTCFGLGYMLGPAVGAWFYQMGGFKLPFLAVGSLSIGLSLLLILTLPHLPPSTRHPESSSPQLRVRTLLRSMSLLMPYIDLFCTLCGTGMLEAMLEPHLKSAGATTMTIGLTFLIFGFCYMIGNLVFGHLIDKTGQAMVFSILGNILLVVAFGLIGPLPGSSIDTSQVLIQSMMSLVGVAYAGLVVSSFSRAQTRVLNMGFQNDIGNTVMISGIWLSAFSLGNFAGPTVAGLMVDKWGFRHATALFFGLYIMILTVDIIEAVILHQRQKRHRQYDKL